MIPMVVEPNHHVKFTNKYAPTIPTCTNTGSTRNITYCKTLLNELLPLLIDLKTKKQETTETKDLGRPRKILNED